jgi:leader peptidase (prepilin peptidase)/N-methyltransferase
MDWGAHLDTAAFAGILGLVAGWPVPSLVARLPEPATAGEGKVAYAALGAQPGMAWRTALWSGVVAALVGASLGWVWPLIFILPLVPIGVALGWVDYRTKLLPKLIVVPSHLLTIVLVLVCTAVTRDLDDLWRAGLGWLIAGAVYWFLWRFTPGMGYGDVRLSGVLGMALAYLGWGEFVLGTYAGFLIGAVGWIPLRLLRITKDRSFPFGPFMLVGAVVGILWGGDLAGISQSGMGER